MSVLKTHGVWVTATVASQGWWDLERCRDKYPACRVEVGVGSCIVDMTITAAGRIQSFNVSQPTLAGESIMNAGS
jgi:hypothetical protein